MRISFVRSRPARAWSVRAAPQRQSSKPADRAGPLTSAVRATSDVTSKGKNRQPLDAMGRRAPLSPRRGFLPNWIKKRITGVA